MSINRFDGQYEFLSNFYPAPVSFEGATYPSVEFAYQAAKTVDPKERQFIASQTTPGRAKRAGQKVTLRPDWESIKLKVMEDLVLQKFTKHRHLAEMLVATGEEEIAEGNHWGDTFFGVCNGEGQNHLGKILMKVRQKLSEPSISKREARCPL